MACCLKKGIWIFQHDPIILSSQNEQNSLDLFITGLLRIRGKVITMQTVHGYMSPYKHLHCIEREVKEAVGAHKPCILKWEWRKCFLARTILEADILLYHTITIVYGCLCVNVYLSKGLVVEAGFNLEILHSWLYARRLPFLSSHVMTQYSVTEHFFFFWLA